MSYNNNGGGGGGGYRSDRDDRYHNNDRQNYRSDQGRSGYNDDHRDNRYDDRRGSNNDRGCYDQQDRRGSSSNVGGYRGYNQGGGGGYQQQYSQDARSYGSNQRNDNYGNNRGSHGGGGANMYSQNGGNRGGGGRVGGGRTAAGMANPGDLVGGADQPIHSVSKKSLRHNTQEFAVRPKTMVQDKGLGQKTTLLTNHTLVQLPQEPITLHVFNIEVFINGKSSNKRELCGPRFWEILKENKPTFGLPNQYIFNDVNMMWSTNKLRQAEGRTNNRRMNFVWKYVKQIQFGGNIEDEEIMQLLSTLIDAIATQRARLPLAPPKYTVFKRLTYLICEEAYEPELPDMSLCHELRIGTDARVGVSIAIRTNLRAGITACFDLGHTLFTRPAYPLVRLLCDIIEHSVVLDEAFEMKYDAALRACNVSDENLRVMTQILTKMTLQLSTETGDYVGEDGEVIVRPAPTIRTPGRNFRFVGLGAPADRYYFTSDGIELTVAEYYLQKYNIRLRYPNLPCVLKKAPKQCGNKHSAMPLELVSYIVVPTRYGGYTMPDMRADMINKTTYTAQQRGMLLQHIIAQKSLSGIEPPVSNNDDYMKKHKLAMNREPIRVKATILPPPTLVYGDSVFHDEDHIGEWEAVTHDPPRQVLDGAVFQRKLHKATEEPLKKRLIGSILLIQSPRQCRDFDYNQQGYHAIMRAIEDSGQPVLWADENKHSAVIQGELQFNQNKDDIKVIEQFLQNIKSTIGEYEREGEVIVPIVFAVFQARATVYSGNNYEYNDYNVLKYLADNKYGIHTQGILEKSLGVVGPSPKNCALTRLMVEKVLGKVGTTHRKLERGGAHKTWTIFTDPAKPTLVLGIDVSHPSTRDRETGTVLQKMSAATVVGNIDLDVTEFRASSRIQDTGVECLIDFSKEIDERIGEFIDHTGKRPAHIVVYRDGLSEGDFQKYLFEERVCIEERCLKIDTSFQPSITYIVVTKRHHTQFFLEDPSQGYESQGYNVLPGTLIEDAVTTNKYYDFFLSTQIGNEGCFRPTHYYVLHDTWTGKPDSFWPTVTHALTYNFCRSTTTVALPAPVLYAHLAAKRAKETLDGINTYKSVNNIYCDLESFGDLCEVNKDMNVNEKLDGMTFV